MIHSFFHKFGLVQNEQRIYLFLLEHGPSIASLIGKRLQIKRVTVYASLESLMKKRLVGTTVKNKVKYFSSVSPEEIISICRERVDQEMTLQKEAESLLPKLNELQSQQAKPVFEIQGKIKYYQGIEAVKNLINETLEEEGKEQLCFGLNGYHIRHLSDDWKQYTERRRSKGMSVRSLQPDIPAAKDYQKRDRQELRITRLVPHRKFPANCEMNVIGDMIALFTTHGDEPTGMKLYNADMAQVLKSLFEIAWERGGEYDRGKES